MIIACNLYRDEIPPTYNYNEIYSYKILKPRDTWKIVTLTELPTFLLSKFDYDGRMIYINAQTFLYREYISPYNSFTYYKYVLNVKQMFELRPITPQLIKTIYTHD